MLAEHIPRELARGIFDRQGQRPAANLDQLGFLNRPIVDDREVTVEHVEMLVRLVELNRKHRRGLDVVPDRPINLVV